MTHKPVGAAASVTPWNFPAAETPLTASTALTIARMLAEAGLPDGVVNVVPTSDAAGVVSRWPADERVRKVSFTGSTGIGRVLLK